MTTILLTGASGYIASHTWLALQDAGYQVVGVDDFSNSSPRVLERLRELGGQTVAFERLNVCDAAAIGSLFERHRIDAVVQLTKQGYAFVFDRVTGEPIWPIEERPVPISGMPGEKSWPTQPFPTVVPPFSKLNFTEDDINPFNNITPEQRAAFRERECFLGRGGRCRARPQIEQRADGAD